jgi:hypothetical protein
MNGKTVGNLILMTALCIVVFWIFMALRPAHAQSAMPRAIISGNQFCTYGNSGAQWCVPLAVRAQFTQHTVKGAHYKEGIITRRKAGGIQQRPMIREGGKTVGARK